jgi:glyoxylase-like metal-dependent hydrolase (beta-lactamase superfamily II)
MKIIPLSEGSFTIDKSKLFVPFDDARDELRERAKGSLLVEVQPFVVITSRDILLLDTGLGFARDGMLQIHRNLINAGINPGEVTKVLLTHLHKDHAGGVSVDGDHERLSFPNALYYVQGRELQFAMQQGKPSFMPGELAVLEYSPHVVLLTGDEGTIDNYITYSLTGAHSPYHQVFRIEEEGEVVFFGGDDAPQLQQMRHRFVAKYDFDGKKAMQLRQQWWEKGNAENWTFLFYHDIKIPVYSRGMHAV